MSLRPLLLLASLAALACSNAAPSRTEKGSPLVASSAPTETSAEPLQSARASADVDPSSSFAWDLLPLLGKRADSPEVTRFIEPRRSRMTQSGPYADASTYYAFKQDGITLLVERGVVGTIFLYSEGYEGNRRYAGPLPAKLSFEDTRTSVRARLGTPTRTDGEGQPGIAPWDKYERDTWSLHVQYGERGAVRLLTVMTVAQDPHRRKD